MNNKLPLQIQCLLYLERLIAEKLLDVLTRVPIPLLMSHSYYTGTCIDFIITYQSMICSRAN